MSLNDFKTWLELKYNSKNTKQKYFQEIKLFFEKYNSLTEENLNNYILNLKQNNYSNSKIESVLNAVKVYFKFSKEEFELPPYPIKQKNTVKTYMEEEDFKNQIICMCSLVFNRKDDVELLLNFMFYTGCRPSEICKVLVKDIIIADKKFIVRQGKGQKDRIIYIMNDEFLNKLKYHMNNKKEDENVFPNLTYAKINYIFNKLREELNLPNDFTPKLTRRSFSRYMHKLGFSLKSIQLMMGHSKFETTEIYLQPDEKMVEDEMKMIISKGRK